MRFEDNSTTNHRFSNTSFFNTSIKLEKEVYRFCGKNDCQDPNVTSANIGKYKPNNNLLFILFGVVSVLSAIGIILHVIFLENVSVTTSNKEVIRTDEKLLKNEEGVNTVHVLQVRDSTIKL